MSDFAQYRRSQIAELRPYIDGEVLGDRVSISAADREAGSPKLGDMIARNPKNHDDQWLVAAKYFADNFEPVAAQPPNAQQGAQTGVPEGYAVVPIEPTDEMCEAAWESNAADYVGEHKVLTRADLTYKAMLAASPAQSKEGATP